MVMNGVGTEKNNSIPDSRKEWRHASNVANVDLDQQLRFAAGQGQSEAVKELLANGARILPDKKGRTALHYAALNGYAEVVRLLLECGTCNTDAVDSSGYAALHKAAGNGHLDVVELLLENGSAEVDIQDASSGNTALHEAAWNGYCKTVELLLANKSNAYTANRAGCTAIHLAAQNGHNQTTRALLHAGCSPDVKNNYGDTPLHTATRYGHAGVTRILIRAKCVISEQNNNGDSPLHIAAAFKRRKIARLLMQGRIDWRLHNKQGETAMDTAFRKQNYEIVDLIESGMTQMLTNPDHRLQLATYEDLVDGSSETNDMSCEMPEPVAADKVATKSKTGFLAWLKYKLTKDKSKSQSPMAGSGSRIQGAAAWKDPKQRMQRLKGSSASSSSQSGLFSQYVKQPGMAFYRDLAGNVREGPAGYVPLYRGAAGDAHPLRTDHRDVRVTSPYDVNAALVRSSNPRLGRAGPLPGESAIADEVLHFDLKRQQAAANQAAANQAAANQERVVYENTHFYQRAANQQPSGFDRVRFPPQPPLPRDEAHFRENPFAYTVGVVQRFADDFQQEQYGRYEVTDHFPAEQPGLFRSRSDETLSHSEYSYHGRAFKSKEAAAHELKALQERARVKEMRRQKRAGLEETKAQDTSKQLALFPAAHGNDEVCNILPENSVFRSKIWRSSEDILETGSQHRGASAKPGVLLKGKSLHQIGQKLEHTTDVPKTIYNRYDKARTRSGEDVRLAPAAPQDGTHRGKGGASNLHCSRPGIPSSRNTPTDCQTVKQNSTPVPAARGAYSGAVLGYSTNQTTAADLHMANVDRCNGVASTNARRVSDGFVRSGKPPPKLMSADKCEGCSKKFSDAACSKPGVWQPVCVKDTGVDADEDSSDDCRDVDSDEDCGTYSRVANPTGLYDRLAPQQSSFRASPSKKSHDRKDVSRKSTPICQITPESMTSFPTRRLWNDVEQAERGALPMKSRTDLPCVAERRQDTYSGDVRDVASGGGGGGPGGGSGGFGVLHEWMLQRNVGVEAPPTRVTVKREGLPIVATGRLPYEGRGAKGDADPQPSGNDAKQFADARPNARQPTSVDTGRNVLVGWPAPRVVLPSSADERHKDILPRTPAGRDFPVNSATSPEPKYEVRCGASGVVAATGVTSPTMDGSIGSNPDSGYGSKIGENHYGSDGTPASTARPEDKSAAQFFPIRREPPSYESWYSQRMTEARLQHTLSTPRTQRRVISTFTTDV